MQCPGECSVVECGLGVSVGCVDYKAVLNHGL